MADGDPTIDARYAAQFQRGYDGPVLTPRTEASTHSTRTAPVKVEGGPPPSAARIPDPPRYVERHAPAEERMDADEPEVQRTTPLIEWSLLALGVVLLGIAVWIFWQASTDVVYYLGGYRNEEITFRSIRYQLVGPLLVAGILAVASWLVLRAIRPVMRS